jgi:hypothetical protein
MSFTRPAALACFALLALAAPARADAIDGRWCAEDGRRMDIEGAIIVTPYGSTLKGDYSRHGFRYIAPAAEPGAGTEIIMRLRNDTIIHLWKDGMKGEPEVWRRCTPVS